MAEAVPYTGSGAACVTRTRDLRITKQVIGMLPGCAPVRAIVLQCEGVRGP